MGHFLATLLTQDKVLWQQEGNNQHDLIVQLLTEMRFYLENIEGVILTANGREVFHCHKVVTDPLNAKIILFRRPNSI